MSLSPAPPTARPALNKRLVVGITISLLVHGLILSMQFGALGLGLPGIELPWSERRAPTPELTVTLANVINTPDSPAIPVPNAPVPPPLPPAAPSVPPKPPVVKPAPLPEPPTLALPPEPVVKPPSGLVMQSLPEAKVAPPPVELPKPIPEKSPPMKVVPTPAPLPTPERQELVQAEVRPPIIAKTQSSDDNFYVAPPTPDDPQPQTSATATTTERTVSTVEQPKPDPVPVPAPAPEPKVAKQDDEALKAQETAEKAKALAAQAAAEKQAEEAKAARVALEAETRKLDEAAREKEKAAALALQAQRQATQKREQEDAARQALEKDAVQQAELTQRQLDAAREASALEAQRQAEAARQQAAAVARQKLQDELAAKALAQAAENKLKAEADAKAAASAAADEANRQKAEASAAAAAQQKELARIAGEKAAAAALRGIDSKTAERGSLPGNFAGGDLATRALAQARKLDLLAPSPSPSRPATPGADPGRRRSIFGGLDQDIGLKMYIDNWRLKIERNGRLNYAQSSIAKSRGDPVVTVAIRSDGSVEDITIHRSSGRPDLDEAVRRIVNVNARFSAFPPALAGKYDVIEIRQIWNFDETLKLLEEVR